MLVHMAPVKFSTRKLFRTNRALDCENYMLGLDMS